MQTITFTHEKAMEAQTMANMWKLETRNIIVNSNTFYDRIDETHKTIVCYYE